jgi:hypothetical protein
VLRDCNYLAQGQKVGAGTPMAAQIINARTRNSSFRHDYMHSLTTCVAQTLQLSGTGPAVGAGKPFSSKTPHSKHTLCWA